MKSDIGARAVRGGTGAPRPSEGRRRTSSTNRSTGRSKQQLSHDLRIDDTRPPAPKAAHLDGPPHPHGEPSLQFWSERLVPPSGLLGLGAFPTVGGFYVRCPACGEGWCRLSPSRIDGFSYFLDAVQGCGRGCHPGDIARLGYVRLLGELPPLKPDVVAARKMRNVAFRLLKGLVAGETEAARATDALARAASEVGAACAIGGLEGDVLLNALMDAGRRLGLAGAAEQQVAVAAFCDGWNDAWGLR